MKGNKFSTVKGRQERPTPYHLLDPFRKHTVYKKRMSLLEKITKPKDSNTQREYDYSTKENRENTVSWLVEDARTARIPQDMKWKTFENYYSFRHETTAQIAETLEENGMCWVPAMVPDCFVQVESQIDPLLPAFEFNGRDDDKDNEKAKMREYTVKYICENNLADGAVSRNERRLLKLGDSFYKVYWDDNRYMGRHKGDISVVDVPPDEIYVDPTAKSFDEAQYVNHIYSIHKNQFYRLFSEEIKKSGYSLDDFVGEFDVPEEDIDYLYQDDLVQIIEHWFRQPYDGKNHDSGDIACVFIAAGHELKYIERYWQKTYKQNKKYPFEQIWRIQDEKSFYNKSELYSIKDLVDAADREFAYAQINDAFTANDILLIEDDALSDDTAVTNAPGATVMVKHGMINSIRRVGGLATSNKLAPTIEFIQGQIDRSTRNYETNMGREPSKVTTASGIAQLRADAGSQNNIKNADRLNGYKRLFELIDWSALEFYDDNREIHVGAKKRDEEDINFEFNSEDVAGYIEPLYDPITKEVVKEGETYYPRLDVTVNVGNGAIKNPAVTLSALDRFSTTPVTKENYKILSAALDILDIPQRQEIIHNWEQIFEIDPEITEILLSVPDTQKEVKAFLEKQLTTMQNDQEALSLINDMEQQLAAAGVTDEISTEIDEEIDLDKNMNNYTSQNTGTVQKSTQSSDISGLDKLYQPAVGIVSESEPYNAIKLPFEEGDV